MGYRTVVEFSNDLLSTKETFIANAGRLYDTITSNGRMPYTGADIVEQVHTDQVSLIILGICGNVTVASTQWNDPTLVKTLQKKFNNVIKHPGTLLLNYRPQD